MENWKRHLFSLMTLLVFLFLAFSSAPDSSITYDCSDPSLKEAEPITQTTSSASYQVTILDKETNMPIPSTSVTAIWRSYYCTDLGCQSKCIMKLGLSTINSDESNASGVVSGSTPTWKANDKKDKMIGEIHVSDQSNLYVPRRIVVQVDTDDSSVSYTIHLIKISSL